MQRCLQLACLGIGTSRPNPSVGAVIVYNDHIISEGHTSPYGGPHAEVNAINSVLDKTLLKKSRLYVTLEPCSHHGKTPPCSDLIIEHEIPDVYIGTTDSNKKVSGKGIAKLKGAGLNVKVGILENECKMHHKRFLTFHNEQRPYIILKWAESCDGFLAPEKKTDNRPVWLTNKYSRQLVHKWRTEEHAILVGTNTVLDDNPSLTARNWAGQNPVRVVLDRKNKLSTDLSVFNTSARTIRISDKELDFNNPIAGQICKYLHQEEIQSVIVEGGARTLQTFINEDIWDEARIFTGNISLGSGVKAPKFKGEPITEKTILEDSLKTYLNPI